MTIQIRSTRPDEFRAAAGAFATALMFAPPDDAAWERSLPSWDDMPSFSAWDGDHCVGHAGHFIVDTTVPGGARLATGAVSRVGVLPTHRRRGLATGLMRALIDDAVERNFALLSLRASEAVIYRRYGFGVAGDYCAVELLPARATPVAGATDVGSFAIVDPAELLDTVPPLYDRVAHRRPGIITRPSSHWWRRYLRAAIERSAGSFVVAHYDVGGEPDGYVHYTVKWDDEHADGPTGAGEIHDLFGGDDSVELGLWNYILDLDLVTRWKADERPVDDLVRVALRDERAYRLRSLDDEQWLRLIDVDAALRARTYRPASGSVTIGVSDAILPTNDGTWRVTAEGAERTDDEPDLATDITTLSAAYLGGRSWSMLAGTGAVDVKRDDAVAVADTLFASHPLPFCGSFF